MNIFYSLNGNSFMGWAFSSCSVSDPDLDLCHLIMEEALLFYFFTYYFFLTRENHNLTFCPSYFKQGNQFFFFFFLSVKGLVPPVFTRLFAEGRSLWALKGCVIVRYYKNTTTELFKKEEMDLI